MAFLRRPPRRWVLRTRTLTLRQRTHVMGIVNVTPDSFSDGGQHSTTEQAIAHSLRLLDEGADILDIGGESTRPGSAAGTPEALSATEEQGRVLPVITGILRERPDAAISVDTYRAATARAGILAGAEIVNDVSGGLWDTAMLRTCADLDCGLVVMHTRGLPSAWASQLPLRPDAVAPLVLEGLLERVNAAVAAGVGRDRIVADPGFGFGKRGAENWAMLTRFADFAELGLPLLAGLSRKGFLTAPGASSKDALMERDACTHTANVAAILSGAHLIRVHDVQGAVQSAAIADAILPSRLSSPSQG